MKSFLKTLALVLVSGSLLAGNVLAQLSTVAVGDTGNPNDTTGYGGVGYDYHIGTYEVTLNQYCTFLNAVASSDPYALYNANLAANVNVAGISRSGSSGSYTYSVIGDGQLPVTYVSWFDSARYVNWLDTGTTETGAYALNGAMSGIISSTLTGSGYRLPTESEWYKAAYYQPTAQGGPASGYWLYATRSSTQPDSRPGNSTYANSGNYYYNDFIANGYNGGYAVNNSTALPTGTALTDVGAYTLAHSFYGTFDQDGNAAEWTDGVFGSSRVVRGGSWGDANIASSARSSDPATTETAYIGFRVVLIPEPGVITFMAVGIALLAWNRKRTL